MLQAGLRALKKYIQEVKVATTPRGLDLRKTTMLWDFTKEETIREWTYIDDKEDVEGQSEATFGPNGKGTGALFQGNLSTAIPSTSSALYSGFCAIQSKPRPSNIFESGRIDVGEYDVFQLKVRGDGRRFIANLRSPSMGRDDELWQHFVFTRGGPEWEIITLPFRDFFLVNRGYMQDNQMSFPSQSVYTFGLVLADRVNGPFHLEIQCIRVGYSLIHTSDLVSKPMSSNTFRL